MSRIIVAAAGAGKTTRIVREALSQPEVKILVTTFTENNIREIQQRFYREAGAVPANVTVLSWFRFLLYHWVRPYQNAFYERTRVAGILMPEGRSAKFIRESDTESYYFSSPGLMYTDKLSRFGLECNVRSGGAVIRRIEQLYDSVYLDEAQDISGYDLDVVETLMRSRTQVILVGDHRQTTYQTNNSPRNSQYRGMDIYNKFTEWAHEGLCDMEVMEVSHRCPQAICDLADSIYPDMPGTTSAKVASGMQHALFAVPVARVNDYCVEYGPAILRYDRRTECDGRNALNFGESKGLEFDHVLIYPHGPLKKWMRSGEPTHVTGSAAKVYVAITRAKRTIAIVTDTTCAIPGFAVY